MSNLETEANDTLATADAVALGTAITGQLSTSKDKDFYSVTTTAAGTLSVVFDVPTNNTYSDYFELGLYNSAGTLLSLFATGVDKTYTVGAPTVGTYYIGVSSDDYYYSSGQYNITASNVAAAANAYESEANDTLATADAVALGTAITGQLSNSKDLDVYSVTTTAAGTLSVVFDVPTNNTYSDYFELGLYNSAGTLLSLFATGVDKTYTVGAPTVGTYYIGVSSDDYYYSSGQYNITASNVAAAANAYESEANDTLATADAVALGTAITGQLSNSKDLDVYSVTTTAAGTLSVVFDVPTNNTYSDYFELGLYNSAGTLLSLFATGVDKTYTVGAPTVGTYYIGVSSDDYYYSSGQYNITASNVAAAANAYESEANDTLATADAVALGTAITGQLSNSKDLDVYSVTTTAAGTLSVVFDVPTNNTYSDYFELGLYNSAGTLLSLFATGVDKTYTVGAPTVGTYYIGVSSDDYYYSSGQYNITASNVAAAANAYESEANDTLATADAVALGTAITGQLSNSKDLDVYSVTTTAAGTLSVVFDVPTNNTYSDYFELGLYNSAGTLLSLFATGVDKTYTVGAPTVGTYYIGVSSDDYYYSSGQYNITASNVAAAANAYESEANDTLATADAVALGTAITGQLSNSKDLDVYSVTTTAAGTLSVVFDVPTNNTYSDYFELGLYNSAGTLLSLFATGVDKTYTVGAPTVGTYYIGVSSDDYYYSSGQYNITASNVAAAANAYESEANDTLATADAVALGTAITGQLSNSKDLDVYSVTTTAAGTLSVVFDVPTNNTYSDYFELGLYNSAGTLLSLFATGVDKTYTVGAPTVGTYYIGVSSDDYYYSSGQYNITASNVAAAANAYESEANDTLATADAVALGTAISGQLASSSDNDYYKLQADQPGVISVVFDAPTNSSYTDYFSVSVVDSNGTLIASHETGKDITFQAAVGAAGSYYVKIDSTNYYYSSEEYKLTASVSSGNSGFELEPNSNFANAIQSGVAIRGQVAMSTDLDWFVLKVAEAGAIAVNFDAPTSSTYTDYFNVRLYDADGNLLASQATGKDITFNANAPAAGNYFVAVSSGDYYYDSGQYALTVTNSKSTVLYESEINNTNAQADPLALGSQIRGQLSSATDEDRFAITLNSSGTITTGFDVPTNSTWSDYFQISIYDQTGGLLSYRSSGSDLTVETQVTSSGTYYIAVSAGDYYYNGGEYKLTVNAKLNDPIPAGSIVGTPVGEKISGTSSDDIVYGLGGNDQIDGGTGVDTAVFRSAVANLSINTIEGLSTIRGNYAAGEHAYSTTRIWNVEKIKTYDGTQALSSASISPIIGTLQNDVLIGTAGADVLDGMGGTDFIDGAAGIDTLVLFAAKEKFTTLTVSGITRIKASADGNEYAGQTIKTTNVENLAFTQSQAKILETTVDAVVFGTAGANGLVGSSANEVFDGQGGNDTIDGGAGSDTVVFFDKADNFTVTFPTNASPTLKVVGKAGTEYANQTLTASNVENLAFTDRTVSVANAPKVVFATSTSILAEGGLGANLEVSLSVAPTGTVTVNLAADSQLTSSSSTLIFDATNWSTPQAVTVTAVDDTVLEGTHKGSLTTTVQSTDFLYKGVAGTTLDFSLSDNGNDLATTGGVSGKLWNDFDKDGSYDVGEARLVGWSVFEDVNKNGKLDSGEAQTTTDATGNYLLGNLSPGSHTIIATTPSGWLPTSPGQGSASGTIISSTAPTGKVTVEALTETIVSAAAAQSTYSNLGTATNIAAFHADPRFANINGQGVAVVIIDSGADLNHAYFGQDGNKDGVSDRIVYQYDFSGKNDADAGDSVLNKGHGTHVAGIIGSSDQTYPGIASAINLIILKVFPDRGGGAELSDIVDAANWVVQNSSKYNIVAVNLSLGNSSFDTTPTNGYLSTQFQSLANQGVVVVSASGNAYAGVQGVSYPSSDPYSLSVGAVWAAAGSWGSAQTGATDAIAVFSQRDDTESDIFAPGVYIDSAKLDGTHVQMGGTSMASPEIAGMVALAQQLAVQELGRRLSFDEIRSLLKSTGDAIVDGDNENDNVSNTGLTFYRADMLALAEAILNLKPPSSYSVTVTAGSTVGDKDFGFAATTAVQALSGDDVVFGTAYGEELRGGSGADQIKGGAGDDKIYGESGDDSLDGGEGYDQAFFKGNKADYTLAFSAMGYTVKDNVGTDGTDKLQNIELIIFADVTLNVDTVAPIVATSPLTGHAYDWKTHTLLSNVDVKLTAQNSATSLASKSGVEGTFGFELLDAGSYQLDFSKALTTAETGSAINSADALAALKIAVGRNPNADGSVVTPYQFIAADANQDGKVTSADALAILKMAVKRTDAPAREWLFVNENQDFWNETTSSFTTTRSSVVWDKALQVNSPLTTQQNVVAVLKGM